MTDQVVEIEEQIEAPAVDGAAQEAPKSIREHLSEALSKSKEDAPEKPVKEVKKTKGRGEDGKFTGKTEPEVKEKTNASNTSREAEETTVEPQAASVAAPQSLSPAIRAKFAQLPPDVQAEFIRRETESEKLATKFDEERNFGRKINEIATPYLATIRAEGSDVPTAFASLLNMAHVLRVGTPQQKSDLLLRTAQTFGVNLQQTQQGQQQVHPALQQAIQKIESLESRLGQEATLKKQQEDAGIQQQIEAFKGQPNHEHFETVKAHMASLLQSNLAKDLQDAYDQAVYANPQTRSTLLAAQEKATLEKRLAEQKARAENAKKAGSSVKGSPGISANRNGQVIQRDLRSELKAQFAAQREG